MGEKGIGRNNQLSENGLLKDSDGNIFDLTEWYKQNSFNVSVEFLNTQKSMLLCLEKIEQHLELLTEEEL